MTKPILLSLAAALGALQPSPRASAQSTTTSAPITDIRYEVTFTRANAERRVVSSVMTFTVGGNAAVILSLPAWTPGAYEISNFARNVSNHVMFLHQGRTEEEGAPAEVLSAPKSERLRQFLSGSLK